MICVKGNMNGSGNNNNNGNNDFNNESGDYPLNNGGYGSGNGFGGYYYYFPEQIFEFNKGNNVDLDDMNIEDRVVAAQVMVDTTSSYQDMINGTIVTNGTMVTSSGNIVTSNGNVVANGINMNGRLASKAQVKIGFSCNVKYTATLNEELDLLFKLYRQDCNGMKIELTSIPYKVAFTGELATEAEVTSLELDKTETFYTEYFDELRGGGMHTYIMEVSLVYSSIDTASIQAGFISATGQIFSRCLR